MNSKFSTSEKQVHNFTASTDIVERAMKSSIALEVVGTAPLIQNCFCQKAMEQMLRKHMGLGVEREKKVPSEVVENATIRNVDGKVCIPPTAFKKAMLSASKMVKLKKTDLRVSLYVEGQSIPIKFGKMTPRMDMVRTSGMNRTPDVRFRPEFADWSARLIIQFSETMQAASVVDLLDRAGSVGIGEWRPEKDGSFGTFSVNRNISTPAEIAEVHLACAVPLRGLQIPDWAMDVEFTPEMLTMFETAAPA